MNFSSDSVKLEIRPHKEDFYLDVETPRGHVFAVLDFAPHDYVNLTPALKKRLEMIITSFESSSRFSPEFFLGFLALELNNYLSNLAKQSGSQPIVCSAALCLVHGNQLSYFLCGDVLLNIFSGGRLVPLYGAESGSALAPEPLGARNSQMTLTNQVKTMTLQDSDKVLILTQGIGKTLDNKGLAREVRGLQSSDPKEIRNALLSASAASRNDRTVVVIGGPFTRSGDTTLEELSRVVASLEAKVNNLSQSGPTSEISSGALIGGEAINRTNEFDTEVAAPAGVIDQLRSNYGSFGVAAALVTLVIALVGGIAGSWFQSRTLRRSPEVWAVRTSGNRIEIARLDESGPSTVSLSLDQPSKTTGEQRFSSFTDAKQYLEMISGSSTAANQSQQQNQAPVATENKPTDSIVEYSVKSGDSLMNLASRHQVSPERLQELNPNITKWRSIQIGQKIALPSPSPASQAVSSPGELVASASSADHTTEISVGPGDSVMKIARRHNISPEELRKLNPTISRWPLLRIGERIALPPAAPANQPASAQGELVSSANSATNTNQVTIGPGDSVIKLARRHNVSPEELRKLNPNISRWPLLRMGDKVSLPSPGAASSPATTQPQASASPASSPLQPVASPSVPAGTSVVVVGRGESLNSLAERYKCSARQLKQLNPRIHNWASIHPGQKILVPALPGS